jgi:hypothetical protein
MPHWHTAGKLGKTASVAMYLGQPVANLPSREFLPDEATPPRPIKMRDGEAPVLAQELKY